MKKFSNFIVEKRHYIISFMLIITVISAILIPNVKINKDMTKYLPDDSPMKEGLTIMEEEFPDTKITGSIRVMFNGLSEDEIPKIHEKLKSIEYVSSVNYDKTEAYNKDSYTLFLVNCNYEYGTKEEQHIEQTIKEEFKDKEPVLQHSIATLLQIPSWVYLVIVAVLLLILFIMCSSYVEPFLFLFTIGVAIVINLGTNLMFGSVAETTFTLSAVLQLALSMDYSIILMNRYRQGKENCESTKEAMKNAYKAAFPSIVSSGMTTVLGLVMLIFMRFKIGLDLGRVMAKGVAISMICVLTVLPALILLFDKWIVKTQKKEINIKTKWLSTFNFKGRKILAFAFAILFISTALLQGITSITFSQPKDQTIESKFPSANPIVILYNNKDSEYISSIIPNLEKDENINTVLGFENTIGKPLSPKEMTSALTSMAPDIKLSENIINLLYYSYYNKDKALPSISLEELFDFIDDKVMKDKTLSSVIDNETKDLIKKIKPLMSKEALEKEQTSKEISDSLQISQEHIELLISLYYSSKEDFDPKSLTVPQLVMFIKNNILDNPLFKDKIPKDAAEKVLKIAPFTIKMSITAPLSAKDLAIKYSFDENFVNQIFTIKFGAVENNSMSVYDFVGYVLSNIAPKGIIPEAQISALKELKMVMDVSLSGIKPPYSSVAEMISVDAASMKIIYTYKEVSGSPDSFKISLYNLINTIPDDLLKDNGAYLIFKSIVSSVVNEEKLTAEKTSELLKSFSNKITIKETSLLYMLFAANDGSMASKNLTIEQTVNHLADNILSDDRFSSLIDDPSKEKLQSAKQGLEQVKSSIVGENHSILMLDTKLKEESKETSEFINSLHKDLIENCQNDYYMIGNSPMNVELENGFSKDLILITALSVIAIFIVVALTFKSIIIPAILVLIVQCGVYFTVVISGLMGHSIYYLALLVVQCILMGATIDYGIVFTNYYIDSRKHLDVKDALIATFKDSIHTILTSSLIIIIITGIIGICPADPAITEICQTLSIGTACVLLLILFVLPGLLACFDKAITKQKKSKKSE